MKWGNTQLWEQQRPRPLGHQSRLELWGLSWAEQVWRGPRLGAGTPFFPVYSLLWPVDSHTDLPRWDKSLRTSAPRVSRYRTSFEKNL